MLSGGKKNDSDVVCKKIIRKRIETKNKAIEKPEWGLLQLSQHPPIPYTHRVWDEKDCLPLGANCCPMLGSMFGCEIKR